MKLVCVSTSRIPSDTANSIQVMKACQGLAKAGHEVHLLVPDFPHAPQSREFSALAEQYGLTTSFDISWLATNPRLKRNDFAWFAVGRAKQLNAEILYTWTGQSAVFGLLRGLPVAYELHDLPTGSLGPQWFRAFRALRGRKRYVIITQALKGSLERRYGSLPDQQVAIAPNGVDLEQYENLPAPEEARRQLGLPEAVTVLCAGHLYAGRGVDLFLGLAERFTQASFVWVGGRTEDVAAAQASAAQRGLQNVTFTGFVSNRRLPCYQSAADVLLMPYSQTIAGSSGGNSADICSPMKMFDYLAAGRAILSSDLPVIHEVLNNDLAEFAEPENLESWSTQLEFLLANPERRDRLAKNAREASHNYSWNRRAAQAINGLLS